MGINDLSYAYDYRLKVGDILNISYSVASIDQKGTVNIGNIEYNTLNGNASLTPVLSDIYFIKYENCNVSRWDLQSQLLVL